MKKFTFKGVLDGFRSSVTQGQSQDPTKGKTAPEFQLENIVENIRSDHVSVQQTFCHGFPYQPTAIAFDPIQRLIAIGTKHGYIRIFGRPGVDLHAKHEADCCAVLHLQFLVNEGSIISSTSDDMIHLWNFKSNKKPEVTCSLKFQRERITCISLQLQSKWLYVGTDRGNVHVVNVETFQLSGYVINWNKAIELSRKTHPGSIIFLGDNPTDSSKLLIGYDSGQLVIWDLRTKTAEARFQAGEAIRSVSWHSDGKQFMCSHSDGSLSTWNTRYIAKPVSLTCPHSRPGKDGKPETCKPIEKIEWKSSRTGENFVIFCGGLTADRAGKTPALTVIHGKTTTVLEMEHNILDFITLSESQWVSEVQDPYAIIVLLQNDLVVIDLMTPGYPCIENPYPMDIHESPVTSCLYLVDCPGDLITALYSVGSKAIKKSGFSERDWPIDGGSWGSTSCSYSEIILTGHADGSVKFWDASSTNLQALYKLKTSKPFEKPKSRRSTESSSGPEDDPFAVQYITLCPESRLLAVAGASSQVLLYKFRKQETISETPVLEIPIIWDVDELESHAYGGAFDFSRPDPSTSSSSSRTPIETFTSVRVKTGAQKKVVGYQVEIVCLTPWVNGEPPGPISSLTLNSLCGLLAYGNESGLVIVDIVGKTCLLNMSTPDLYGTADPYQRAPKSPKRPEIYEEKSPTDQVSEALRNEELATPNNTPNTKSPPTTVDSGADDDDSQSQTDAALLGIAGSGSSRSGFSGSTGRLPTMSEAVNEEVLKTRATTPPADPGKVKGRTWTQVKEKFKNFGAAGLKGESDKKKTSGGGGGGDAGISTATSASSTLDNIQGGGGDELGCSSDDSCSSPPMRPDNLPLSNEGSSSAPVAPPRMKKKKSSMFLTTGGAGGNVSSKKTSLSTSSSSKCVDLRSSGTGSLSGGTTSGTGSGGGGGGGGGGGASLSNMMKKIQKIDNTFSRSRSSSMSSLDNITSEAIQCLVFSDSLSRKADYSVYPTLWVGTSLGSVVIVTINLPGNSGEYKKGESISVSPSGTIFRLKGGILAMAFLDCNASIIPSSYEPWKDESKDQKSKTPTKGGGSRQSPTQSVDSGSGGSGDRQFAVLVSEKQCRILTLPSQTCLYKQQLCDTAFVIKADVTTVKDSSVLVCYLSTGHLQVYSLPSLRQLVDVNFVPLTEFSFHQTRKSGIVDPMLNIWGQQYFVNEDANSIAKTFCISSNGHGMYLSSPSELQKFSVSADFCQMMDKMVGELYADIVMPERPKEGFFTGLFGVGVKPLDREELFGEASGKSSKTVAKHIPGSSMQQSMEQLQLRQGTAGAAIAAAKMQAIERGEKLSQLEDRTAKMSSEAENFSNAAHQLMLKYKDKKWYQL